MFASSAVSHVADDGNFVRELVADASRYAATVQLVESLLHDVRNPLNALAINAEVLVEKLKDEGGRVPPGPDKNLRAIREQVQRVDHVLRQFAQFLAPPSGPGKAQLTEWTEAAVEMLGHESRRRRVKLRAEILPDVQGPVRDRGALSFLVYRPILRAIERTPPGSEVLVALAHAPDGAVLTVRDGGGGEASPEARLALEASARRLGAEIRFRDAELRLALTWA